MGIMFWIAFGAVAGSLAKLVMPGPNAGGLAAAIPVGVAGALLGGFIGIPFGVGSVTGFDFRNLLMALTGSLMLLLLYRAYAMRGVELSSA